MKALNLKSMSWIIALAMMFIVSFTGCSDDDGEDGGPIAPVFPELKETNCGANETTEISLKQIWTGKYPVMQDGVNL